MMNKELQVVGKSSFPQPEAEGELRGGWATGLM